MTTPQEQDPLAFDILTYPRDAYTSHVLVDVGNDLEPPVDSPIVRSVGRGTIQATSGELVAQYAAVAEDGGHPTERTVLVSDRLEVAEAAVETGMGVVAVEDAGHVEEPLTILLEPKTITDELLYDNSLYTDLSYEDVARALFRPGQVNIVGFVGRTGAGKSTSIRRLVEATKEVGGDGGLFEIDAFFIRSRAERKAWLKEPGISDEERTKRHRVATWWNLDYATETLERVRNGEHVRIENVYDMQRGGEMVGVLDVDPGDKGYTVFVEGTTLLLPKFYGSLDSVVYINAHDQKRTEALTQRNLRNGYTLEESQASKLVTDAAETNDHVGEPLRKERFRRGNLTVLDNTHRGERLRIMPPYIPRK